MLVLLAAVATGAMAQTTYKVSVKEGTEDATSWTIAPAEATTTGVAAGTEVKATYSGTKKVKSVKAVKKAPAVAEGHALSASVVGDIVGTDGNVYAVADKDNLPEGVTAVAMVAYKSATTGKSLAIALADEGSMNWNSARSTCGGKTAIGGKSWKLPTMDEWNQMFSANGGDNTEYTGLNTAITTAGGTTLQESTIYWSSSEGGEYDEDRGYEEAYRVELYGGNAYWDTKRKNQSYRVRAVLAF